MSTEAEKARKRAKREAIAHRFRLGPVDHAAAEAAEAKQALLETPLGKRALAIQQGRNRMAIPIGWDEAVRLAKEQMGGEQ